MILGLGFQHLACLRSWFWASNCQVGVLLRGCVISSCCHCFVLKQSSSCPGWLQTRPVSGRRLALDVESICSPVFGILRLLHEASLALFPGFLPCSWVCCALCLSGTCLVSVHLPLSLSRAYAVFPPELMSSLRNLPYILFYVAQLVILRIFYFRILFLCIEK